MFIYESENYALDNSIEQRRTSVGKRKRKNNVEYLRKGKILWAETLL